MYITIGDLMPPAMSFSCNYDEPTRAFGDLVATRAAALRYQIIPLSSIEENISRWYLLPCSVLQKLSTRCAVDQPYTIAMLFDVCVCDSAVVSMNVALAMSLRQWCVNSV